MKDEYKTKDLAEAAALIVEGQELYRIERDNRTCWFIYKNRERCEELSNKFFFGGLLVNGREFYETMNRLKNRIFASY